MATVDMAESPGVVRKYAYLWIGLAVILAHGITVFADMIVGDDWLTLVGYRDAAFRSMWLESVALKVPLNMIPSFIFLPLGGHLQLLRAVDLIVLFFLGVLIYEVLNEVIDFHPIESLWVAILFITFPAYKVQYMVNYVFLPLSLSFSLFALMLLLRCESKRTRPKWLVFTVSYLLLLLSLSFGALLLAYPIFLLVYFLGYRRAIGQPSFFKSLVQFLRSRFFLLTPPVLVWTIRVYSCDSIADGDVVQCTRVQHRRHYSASSDLRNVLHRDIQQTGVFVGICFRSNGSWLYSL